MKYEIRKYIDSLGENLYNEFNLTPNFDVEKVVIKLGGEIKYAEYTKNFYPLLIKKKSIEDKNDFSIIISKDKNIENTRLSVCKLLGHLFLHMNFLDKEKWIQDNSINNSKIYRYSHGLEQFEANEFAISFLMPTQLFLKTYNDIKSKYNNRNIIINKIAKKFGVSENIVKTKMIIVSKLI